jgi:hypothetical protein
MWKSENTFALCAAHQHLPFRVLRGGPSFAPPPTPRSIPPHCGVAIASMN